jgi:hypothetical protein
MTHSDWQPIETAPLAELVDVLFDPTHEDDPGFYCPGGKATGLWRLCAVYFDGSEWWHSDGLSAMTKRPIRNRLTHWMALPKVPTA